MNLDNLKTKYIWRLGIGLLAIGLLAMLLNSATQTSTGDTQQASDRITTGNYEGGESNTFDKGHMTNVMEQYGFSSEEASYVYDNCSTRNNPRRCVVLFTHASWHETKTGTLGVGKSKNNLAGLKKCGSTSTGTFCYHPYYPNRMASFEDWVERYNKYWYKNDCMEMIDKSEYTPHNP